MAASWIESWRHTIATLPPDVREIFDRPYVAHLSTIMADGRPHVTPVAVIVEGDYLLVDCDQKTVKAKNMKRDPRVALSVTAPENPWITGWARGRVVEISSERGWEVLDLMALKYGRKSARNYDQPTRLVFKIEVEKGKGTNLDAGPFVRSYP